MGCLFADEIIVISEEIQKLIRQKYKRVKGVHLIHNGVTPPEFCEDSDFFNTLSIEKNKYILNVGRLVPEKNLHHLIEAFSQIDNQGYKLVIAGDSDFEDNYSRTLKQSAKEKGVVLTGFIKGKKLHALLSHAKCFVLPSSHEGLPIALLEAMTYQLPVIVSDIPAHVEINLEKNCYFPCGDINALKLKLQNIIIQNTRQIKYDMKKYDWDIIAQQTLDIYNSLYQSK